MAEAMTSSSLIAARLQVCVIYVHAALGKLGVEEWRDGTALYYWLLHPDLGVAPVLRGSFEWLLQWPVVIAPLTWGSVALELLLAAGLIASKRAQQMLLVVGIGFHCAIGLLFGLASFSMIMSASLVLYLAPVRGDYKAQSLAEDRASAPGWMRKIQLRLGGSGGWAAAEEV